MEDESDASQVRRLLGREIRAVRLGPTRSLTDRHFRAFLLAGLLLRAVCLPLPGTEDVEVWKTWSYAATNGISTMYGVGGNPPERGVVTWGERHTTVDYPPAALYGLAIVGHAYRAWDPAYRNAPGLTIAIKLSIAFADVAVCALLWMLLRRRYDDDVARLGALFYWLNPATLMDGAVLGYLDPWAGALVMGAVVAADAGAPAACGAVLALAVMTKAQSILIVPFVSALLLTRRRADRLRAGLLAAAAGVVATALLLAPYARVGALPNVRQGVGSLFRHDMLSGTAANAWWIVTWLLRASYAAQDLGARAAWTMTVRILAISRVVELGYPNPRPIAAVMAGSLIAWAFWRARSGSLAVALAAGAVAVHAYFVLAVQVHENHLYLALPLMAGAAAALPRLRAPFYLVSAVFALNLFLFYGIGRGFALPPRTFTIVDATVLLSTVNLGALAWHARRYSLWK